MKAKKARRRVSPKELKRLEDQLDLADALRAMKEEGRNIPWAQVKKELGL